MSLGRIRTIWRAAAAKSDDPVMPDTPHAQVLLPVPGRSRDKVERHPGRSYARAGSRANALCQRAIARHATQLPSTLVNTLHFISRSTPSNNPTPSSGTR